MKDNEHLLVVPHESLCMLGWQKECVAALIGLYKNSGAVMCVGFDFTVISGKYVGTYWQYKILAWAVSYRNCNPFLAN